MKKRLLSLLAVFCLMATMVPVPVRADNGGGGAAPGGPEIQTPSDLQRINSLQPAEGGTKAEIASVKINSGAYDVYEIRFSGAATPSNSDAAPGSAYWVGVGIAAPAGYTSVAYAKGDYSTDTDLDFTPNNDHGTLDDIQKGDDVKGFAFWFDAESIDSDGVCYSVKWSADGKTDLCEVYRFIWEGRLGDGDPDTEPTAYKITIASGIEHGSVTADKDYAMESDTVTLTVTPDKGYQLAAGSLTVVKTGDGATGSVSLSGNGTLDEPYTFIMPESKVEIRATFVPAALTGTVTIEGEPRVGETLKVSVADSNNTGTLSYQWYASGSDIAGATKAAYTLTDAEIGKRITCRVTSDVQTGNITSSSETAPVVGKDTVPTVYKVTFDMNGHGTAPKEQSVYAGGKAEKPANPTASGWTFGGWFKDDKCTAEFDFDSAITADTVIYAKWTENPSSGPENPVTYKITIASGIEHGSVTADKDYATAGDAVTLTVTPDKGYQLKELTATPDTVIITNNTFTMPEGDVTIRAVFVPAPLTGTVTIAGMPRSGETLKVSVADSNNTGTLSYQWYASESDIAGATEAAYTLTDAEIGKRITCTVASDVQTGSVTSAETAPVVDKDAELTAYQVTFDMNGHGTAPAAQTVYAGGKATRPVDPAASGWTFGGWFKDAAGEAPFDFDSEIMADTVIYAKWTGNQPSGTYTITIDPDIKHGSVTADKVYATEGDTVTLTITPNSGYSLSAITTTPTLTLSGSDNTRTFTMPASDVTVSATFAANSAAGVLKGTVAIVGDPWVGETLYARVTSTNNTGVLHYQWTADGYDLYGETSRYLNLTRYEIGKVIRCVVTSSVQTGSITGRLWGTVDYYDSRYYPAGSSTNNNASTGANQGGNSAETEDDYPVDTPVFATATNADGTKTTTITEPDGSSGVIILTSYGAVSSASMTFSSSAFATALRTGSALTLPATVHSARSADSATPVWIVLPQATGTVKVRIPVSQMTAGTVAVMENYFGSDTVVRSSVSESNGVLFELTGSAVVKIVDNSRSFSDVSGGAWYANAVNWASSREVMNGVSAQMFDPQGTVNRAMMAQMLYNFDGAYDTDVSSRFSDVSSDDWYAASVNWAAKNAIAGNGMERFGAEDALTRESMATMLYNYARAKGYNPYASGSMLAFSDSGSVSDWARTAMQWAVNSGLIAGTQNGTKAVVLDPQGTVTRAQLATIMQRFNNLY